MARRIPLALAAVAAAAAGAPAEALEWRISSFLSQRFLADDNLSLEPDGSAALGSVTNLGATFTAASPTTELFLSPGFRIARYAGDDADSRNDVSPRLNGGFTHQAPRLALDGSLSVIPEEPGDNDLDTRSAASGVRLRPTIRTSR